MLGVTMVRSPDSCFDGTKIKELSSDGAVDVIVTGDVVKIDQATADTH